jgi:hypothetical protein
MGQGRDLRGDGVSGPADGTAPHGPEKPARTREQLTRLPIFRKLQTIDPNAPVYHFDPSAPAPHWVEVNWRDVLR